MTAVRRPVTTSRDSASRRKSRKTRAGAVPPLWHFTCDHFATQIVAVGALVPHRHPYFPSLGRVVWLTSQPNPERYLVGLTSDTLDCDRMAHRFRVTESDQCLWWPDVRDLMRAARQPGFDAATVRAFEYGRAPETWWLSPLAVPVVRA